MVCVLFTQALGNRRTLIRFGHDAGLSLPMFVGTILALTRGRGHHASSDWTMISIAVVFLVLSTAVSPFVDPQDLSYLPNHPSLS